MSNSHYSKSWQQLAVMLEAGLPLETALSALSGNKTKFNKALTHVIRSIKRGLVLSEALYESRLIARIDCVILRVAEKAGKLPAGLHYIAQRNLNWQQHIAHLRSALYFPKGLLLIGALAAVLSRVYAENQSVWGAISTTLPLLLGTWFLIELSVWLLEKERLTWLSIGWRVNAVRRYSRIYQLVFESFFYRLFLWQLESGVAFDQALSRMSVMLHANQYKLSVRSSASPVNIRNGLTATLYENGLVLSKELLSVLQTSEEAGVLEKAVNHHIKWQQQVIADYVDQVFKWLPKVYYLIVLLVISRMMIV